MDTITTHIKGYGDVTVTSAALDITIAKYLPASPNGLRALVAERDPDTGTLKYADVSQLLMILADFDYNVDDSPFRVGA